MQMFFIQLTLKRNQRKLKVTVLKTRKTYGKKLLR